MLNPPVCTHMYAIVKQVISQLILDATGWGLLDKDPSVDEAQTHVNQLQDQGYS